MYMFVYMYACNLYIVWYICVADHQVITWHSVSNAPGGDCDNRSIDKRSLELIASAAPAAVAVLGTILSHLHTVYINT